MKVEKVGKKAEKILAERMWTLFPPGMKASRTVAPENGIADQMERRHGTVGPDMRVRV